MTDSQLPSDPASAVADPLTGAATLRLIAYHHPELRASIALHPNAYEGLIDWLDSLGDPAVSAAVAQRRMLESTDLSSHAQTPNEDTGPVDSSPAPAEPSADATALLPEATAPSDAASAPVPSSFDASVDATAVMPAAYTQPGTSASAMASPIQGGAPEAVQYPAYAPAQYPTPEAPVSTRSNKKLVTVFVLLVILALVLGFASVWVFTNGFGSGADSSGQPAASAPQSEEESPREVDEAESAQSDTAEESAQSDPAEESQPVRYPAPSRATEMSGFLAPSGNVTCVFAEDGTSVVCQIKEGNWSNGCSQGLGTLRVSEEKAEKTCENPLTAGSYSQLPYGEYAKKGDFACGSTADGFSCWNVLTGRSFALAREGWMTGSEGEILPNRYSW